MTGGEALAERKFDIAVIGAGLGGVVAAVRAAELGRRVLLAEAGDYIGGTALHSGGGIHIWGAADWEAYRRHCPLADPMLARALFDEFAPLVAWLQRTGAPGAYVTSATRGLTLAKYQLGDGIAARGRIAWFRFMIARLEALGGRVERDLRATQLSLDGGRVTGFVAEREGRAIHFAADHVVLAAGGFQNAPDLMDRYIAPHGRDFLNRGAATNRGDGLRLALAAGAAESGSMDTLYGHLMPALPCIPRRGQFMDLLLLSAFYAEHGIVVNGAGERFVDEAAGELNGETINAAARQPQDNLWILMDRVIRDDHARYALPQETFRFRNWRYASLARYLGLRRTEGKVEVTMDSLRFARDRGASIETASSIHGLADRLAARGVNRDRLLATVADYNAAALDGLGASLAVPRSRHAHPILAPPFHAIKVRVGVSMTYGGVRIDPKARVMHSDGGAIEGLLAVPGTAGGIHYIHYAGALAACATFGKIAAETAVEACVK